MDRLTSHNRTRLIGILTVLGLWLPSVGSAQDTMVEEIVVGFEVPKLVSKDIFVQYNGTTVFVPVIEVFSLLDFQVQADLANERISGTVREGEGKFVIDLTRFHVKGPGVERDLLRTDYYYDGREFYVRVDLFGELFGLHMMFDFSLLRVKLPLSEDFPAYQRLQRQMNRKKLMSRKEALRDVLTLTRGRGYASGGAADWRISTNPMGGGAQHFSMDLGGMLLGGDLKIGGSGNTRTGFDPSQIDYHWHYFVDRGKYVSQADLGRVYTTGSLGRSLTGARVTNQPQVRREYFRTIQLTGAPGAGWEVELYVDGRLMDFQTTGEAGTFDFNVDVFYGASNVELKLYGPNGEIETQNQHYRIPFNLIPKGEVEYTVAGGEGQGRDTGRGFVQSSVHYGLMTRLTSGLNIDLPLSPLEDERPLYSFETTVQLATNLTFSGSYSPSNRSVFDANYIWPSVISVGAHVTKFEENQFTNWVRQQSRWRLSLSSPLRIGGHYLGLRYNISRDRMEAKTTTNMTYGFNTSIKPVHLNYVGQYTTTADTLGHSLTTGLSSKIMGSLQLHRKFRPQFLLDYDHTINEIVRYSVSMTKRLWRSGQFTFTYERNPLAGISSVMVSLSFFTDFLDFSSRTQMTGDRVTMTQQQRGSIRFDHNHNRFMFDRRGSVGYGSAVVAPFLDDNYNGLKDPTEQELSGLKAKITGAGGRPRGGDGIYYYDRLRPYDEYLVQIDQYSLDDPTLKPSNENYKVTLNPSVVTAIEVPIVTASEISGSVTRPVGDGITGVGGIRVMLLNISKDVLTEVMTFNDGEYYYLGLLPGQYRAYLDPAQLSQAGYRSEPESLQFDVKPVVGGEIVENISFQMVPAGATGATGATGAAVPEGDN